ncbi:MAG TPA: hypothetical protein VGZ47_16215 [Gemmataceae bacterium]|nr:hypothetical protein [Gemmataceae bacterium]
MINVDRDPENGEVQGILAFAEPTDDTRKLVYGVDHAPIYGYLSGNDGILLPQLLRESTLSQWSESREGRRLQVIQGKGRWGTHTLWLDPEHDYLPHRIEQWKEGRDWWAKDKPVSNFPRDRGDRVWPKTQVRSLGERLEATKIEQINGDHVMTAFVWTKENVYETGETVTFRMEVRLSDVDLKPDFSSTNAFAVSTPVPNGTPVQVDDRRGIRYEWRDGQIVNSLNQEAITSLERHSFWRRSAWGRGLLALAIVVVAGGSVLMWYVRRARKAGVP